MENSEREIAYICRNIFARVGGDVRVWLEMRIDLLRLATAIVYKISDRGGGCVAYR